MRTVKIGLIGSGFVSEIHAESLKQVCGAEILAVASPTEEHVRSFAERHQIPHWFTDYRQLLEMEEIEVVTCAVPNYLHCQVTVEAASAGKHVIVEKPLCITLEEADQMIQACAKAGVKLMYAEELCFTPKYVRAKQLVEEGALGKVYLIKQSEKHFGPHTPWFWDVEKSGGGVTLDMGCHAFQFFRWILNNAPAVAVTAQMGTYVHKDLTQGDDDALIIVEFEGGARGLAEESWAKRGGMDDRAEIYGSEGVTYANLLQGNALITYSEIGYGYAVEKAPSTQGWTFTIYEEAWNYGFPQEFSHFLDCVRDKERPPLVTGEDGKAVLEIIYAAYESAGTGRRVELPFQPPSWAKKPIDLWLKRRTSS